jgi:putative transposase
MAAGVPYHVTQRGNGRQQIFFEDRDYSLYQDLLRGHCQAADLVILAYCLMPNHIHLIGVPGHAGAMAQAMGRTNADFARYYNLRRCSCGHVWQARYFSAPLDGAYLWQAMAYVERNPVRARLAEQAEDYAWSSARLRLAGAGGFVDLTSWRAEYDWLGWRAVLRSSVDEEAFGRRLQEGSRRGRPLGDEQFIEELERLSGRRLRARRVGRPRKVREDEDNQLTMGFGV